MAACLSLAACGEKELAVAEPDSRPVKLMPVSVGNKDTFRTFPATVEAGDKAILAFRVSGELASISVNAGDVVKKGKKLAMLNVDELTQLMKQAQANYQLALVQFNRDVELRKTKVISELDYDTSKAALKQAKASLDKAKANLSYATLLAPYDGNISLSLIENYEFVNAKEPVLHIQSAGLINVTFQLPDHLFSRFKGYTNTINPVVTFDTELDKTYPAQFKEVDTEADPKTSSYKVTLYMERPRGKNILPGMSGQVRIKIPRGKAGAIPLRAIITEGSATYVWRVSDEGLIKKTAVELDENNRITQGLQDGDLIATSGVDELADGQKVRSWIKERGL
ncbi:efflux RND transporter periplasmic adaptor subunit [Photobacterium sanguinicancri]|uniref:efflux RND transporter periplasmic adaptor subunit n=1 Tax=Photobacterium sanguinicancri TaxID=875932 RepID=UPI0026E3EFD6|nr:efflux RND transporter periplasmic adaptor subunit [Photobacterium sanguinicancri]MDO6497153.1 efflux RND transporter periplasmic adaptor subunit [Photobacterium sanguinicancri]